MLVSVYNKVIQLYIDTFREHGGKGVQGADFGNAVFTFHKSEGLVFHIADIRVENRHSVRRLCNRAALEEDMDCDILRGLREHFTSISSRVFGVGDAKIEHWSGVVLPEGEVTIFETDVVCGDKVCTNTICDDGVGSAVADDVYIFKGEISDLAINRGICVRTKDEQGIILKVNGAVEYAAGRVAICRSVLIGSEENMRICGQGVTVEVDDVLSSESWLRR